MTPSELEFIQEMTDQAVKQNSQVDIPAFVRNMIGLISSGDPESEYRKQKEIAEKYGVPEAEYRNHRKDAEKYGDPGAEVVAPVPKYEGNEEYDSLRSVLSLPVLDALPGSFASEADTVARINKRTVAMAHEHYFDLISVRNECKQLREDYAQLQNATLGVYATYSAIRDCETGAWFISRSGKDMYYVNKAHGQESFTVLNESLPIAVEEVLSQVKAYEEEWAAKATEAVIDQEAQSPLEPAFDPGVEPAVCTFESPESNGEIPQPSPGTSEIKEREAVPSEAAPETYELPF